MLLNRAAKCSARRSHWHQCLAPSAVLSASDRDCITWSPSSAWSSTRREQHMSWFLGDYSIDLGRNIRHGSDGTGPACWGPSLACLAIRVSNQILPTLASLLMRVSNPPQPLGRHAQNLCSGAIFRSDAGWLELRSHHPETIKGSRRTPGCGTPGDLVRDAGSSTATQINPPAPHSGPESCTCLDASDPGRTQQPRDRCRL